MNSLLPGHSTEAELALEHATARLGNVDVPITRLWNPATCPADILPWLAWAFSVDRWDPMWTEAQKRAIVAASIFVHRRKGTPAAVKAVINAIFGGGDVVEAWQDADLSPHEFAIVTTGTISTDQQFDELIDLVGAAKPVRSHLVSIRIQRASSRRLYFGTAMRAGAFVRVRSRLSVDAPPQRIKIGTAMMHAAKTTITMRP